MAKTFLERARRAGAALKVKKLVLDEIEAKALPKAVNYDGIHVQTSPQNGMEEIMALYYDADKDYQNARDIYVTTIREVRTAIEGVRGKDPDMANILTLRYECGQRCEQIAEQLNYSERSFFYKYRIAHRLAAEEIKRLHKSAVRNDV